MIGRRRSDDASGLDLAARAQAAVRGVGEGPRPRGGLTGVLARALRGRRRRPDTSVPPAETADAAEVRTLRAELIRELDRVAARRAEGKSGSPVEDAQGDAAG